MVIAIDTSPLTSGHKNRGVGLYTKYLIEALNKDDSGHTYRLFDNKNRIPKSADIIHYPYFDPFFLTLPVFLSKPAVVTVHDLIPLVFPDHFPSGIRGSVKWQIQKYALKNKQGIITDSECSKNDIHNITNIPRHNIDVVYLAPSLSKSAFAVGYDELKKQLNLSNPYFLYVGDVNWNKNILGLLRGFAEYLVTRVKARKQKISLILVGKAFLDSDVGEVQEINRMIAQLHLQEYVVKPGYVNENVLAALYTNALGLIQPSLYEGFGFPVLEAMTLGCPVICSSTSSLPEIAGPALMIDPKNPASLSQGMDVIESLTKGSRIQLIQKGNDWVKKFTWSKVAKDTISVYEKVLGHK